MRKENLFKEGKITKTILTLSLPLILSQIVNVLYNIVDRIFIGNMKDVGRDALAGVGITFPIIIIVSAFAALFGLGGAPLVGIKLGEKKVSDAKDIMMNSFIMLVITSLILSTVLLIFNRELLYLFGITDELMKYGLDYLNIYAIGILFVMISIGMNFYISAQGYTKEAAIFVLIGAILNIVLDPILIYSFNLGVKGAAIATIFSQGISAILILIFLMSEKSVLKFSFKDFKINAKIILSVLALGISPFIMQSTEALIQIVFNTQIVKYGGSNYVAYLNIMTIMLSLLQFMVLPVHGLTQGASPLISYNFGSKNMKRVKESYKTLIIMSFIYSFSFYLIIFLFPKPLASIFGSDLETLKLAPKIFRIFFFGMAFFGIQLASQASFMALGEALVSLTNAILRKIVILIPLAYLLPLKMGIMGVFIAEPIADILATIITFSMFIFLINKILNKKLLEDRSYLNE